MPNQNLVTRRPIWPLYRKNFSSQTVQNYTANSKKYDEPKSGHPKTDLATTENPKKILFNQINQKNKIISKSYAKLKSGHPKTDLATLPNIFTFYNSSELNQKL